MIPPEANLSEHASDLIRKLCCGPNERLGRNGAHEIKEHPFFAGVNFDPINGIRKQEAPYKPILTHDADTSNFEVIESELHGSSNGNHHYNYVNGDRVDYNGKSGDHAFFEFTFRRFFDDAGQPYPIRFNDIDRLRSAATVDSQGSPVYV